MNEILNIAWNAPSPVPVSPGVVSIPNIENRSVRLITRKALDNSTIGIHEFQLFSAAGLNYCYDSAFKPVAEISENSAVYAAYSNPYTTIDGNISTWESSVYLKASTANNSFIQYNFKQNIDPKTWKLKIEGSYHPKENDGMALHIFRNGRWVDITGTKVEPGWSSWSFLNFNI